MADDVLPRLRQLVGEYDEDMVDFAQRLVQTPSPSGQEGEAAALVLDEMDKLSFDDAWIDRAGNVIGLVRGVNQGRSIMFNAHLDHVPAGAEAGWLHAPFAGDVAGGALWGRGSVDLKGSVAAQVYGIGALRRRGVVPPWSVYVAAVVCEEIGGFGTGVVLEQVRPDFCVIGEATRNQLSLGHRGTAGLVVEISGRAAHASMVKNGINPHFSAARLILGLGELEHQSDPLLGPSTVAPTLYQTDQTASNVIPGMVRMYLDWRRVPGEDADDVVASANALLQRCLGEGATGAITLRQYHGRTYTGVEFMAPGALCAVKTDPGSDLAANSRRCLEAALGRSVEFMTWRFCSDGSICADAGVPIVGFGPGDPELAHTADERVPISELCDAVVGNAALAMSPALTPSSLAPS